MRLALAFWPCRPSGAHRAALSASGGGSCGSTHRNAAEARHQEEAFDSKAVKQYLWRVRQKYARAGRAAWTKVELYYQAVEDGCFSPAIRAAAGSPHRPLVGKTHTRGRQEGDKVPKLAQHGPTWDDADRFVRIVSQIVNQAVKLILALHGIR